ncbi:serine hydrolase domain-containing protein [Chitinimonas sp.]|uniref:serine hydrolase domain-containing protein n=1 Tax=Chitinimonas sp. TaxID=1934313 RepID=UPI002F935DBD
MSRLLRIGLCALVLVCGVYSQADDLDKTLHDALMASRVPAVGVAVLKDGQVDRQAVLGRQRNDRPDKVALDDKWLIGSTGKVMTVALMARLVEQQRLDWDSPLAQMLPELANSMRPEYRKVTLAQLLSHRAGLPRDMRDLRVISRYLKDKRDIRVQRAEFIARALQDAPEGEVGSFAYSNTGFIVAAAIAERATGQSFEALMRDEVFAPLAMQGASFGAPAAGEPMGHQHGKPMRAPRNVDDGLPAIYAPAGFVRMSLADWARFNLDQLAGAQGKGRLLSDASYKLMQTAQPGGPAAMDWGVQPSIMGRKGPVLVHAGSDGNWLAYVILFPESGAGVLAVANAGEDMGSEAVLRKVLGPVLVQISPPFKAEPEAKMIGQ